MAIVQYISSLGKSALLHGWKHGVLSYLTDIKGHFGMRPIQARGVLSALSYPPPRFL